MHALWYVVIPYVTRSLRDDPLLQVMPIVHPALIIKHLCLETDQREATIPRTYAHSVLNY